jgi:Bacterial Ig-like domain (group 3)
MSHVARLWGRHSSRRPAPPRFDLEVLEERTLLSGTGASHGSSDAKVSSTTVLTASLPTAVTGADEVFTATPENAADGSPIPSGKVTFVVEAPQKIVLGTVKVNKTGQASIATDQLTKITTYQVKAEYTPAIPQVSASVSARLGVKVIPQPLHVPTDLNLEVGAPMAESGQKVPLLATVTDAGTGNQVDAGKVQPISGTLELYVNSPHRIVLGKVVLNPTTVSTPSSILSAIESIFGQSNQPTVSKGTQRAYITTDKLKDVGPYQIEARFTPSNSYFRASATAPQTVTVTPRTQNEPTVTSLTTPASRVETGEGVTLNVTVEDPSSTLAGGQVKFVTMSSHPVVLGKVPVSTFDQEISFTTDKLQGIGVHRVKAVYMPGNSLFAGSTSAPVTVAVTPLTATSFRVRALQRFGTVHEPIGFNVTALDAQGQRLPDYTGTVVFTSPTDSLPNLPAAVYTNLHISPPSPATPGMATFNPGSYTFTPADQGSHTFLGGVTFGKGGAESIQVIQANDTKVTGKTTVSIE